MARKAGFLSPRKAIYVFWEGESEEAYTKYLKKRFSGKATIIIHGEKGTFHTAKSYFRGNKRFQSNVKELTDGFSEVHILLQPYMKHWKC